MATKRPEVAGAGEEQLAQATATAPAQSEAPAKGEDRKITPIDDQRFKLAEHGREHWLATAHENTRPSDLLRTDYWAHVSNKLRPRARIEMWANDGSWMAEYVVLEASRNWARVAMLQAHILTGADISQTQADGLSPYEIAHRGPHHQWSVIRKIDREVMHDGEPTMQGCVDWLQERMKADKR